MATGMMKLAALARLAKAGAGRVTSACVELIASSTQAISLSRRYCFNVAMALSDAALTISALCRRPSFS